MVPQKSYSLSVPVVPKEGLDRQEILRVLRDCGAQRIFLALGMLSLNSCERASQLVLLKDFVSFFQAEGFQVGIWVWTLWYKGIPSEELDELLMVNMEGKNRSTGTSLWGERLDNTGFCCPASEKFLQYAEQAMADLALLEPDLIMLDDDFRFAFLDADIGCFCPSHMALYEEKLGHPVTREEMIAGIYSEQPNPIRKVFLDALGESLENLARVLRKGVDRVNPRIRLALCSVMSLWDLDGTDSVKIAKLLAGDTKPLLRLIGAPYWAPDRAFGCRLSHVIETERMEYAWCQCEDMEIMTEGDTFPRPRYRVPASYLEGFDTALRAAGVGDGILKYMLDDRALSAQYELGYCMAHQKNMGLYEEIARIFGDKQPIGVRVYEPMNKLRDSDLSGADDPREYVQNQFFSMAAKLLADNTVPTMYTGNDGVGMAFGENARNLPEDAFKNPLIMDVRAAGILMEQGLDVGITHIGPVVQSDKLWYPQEKTYVSGSGACRRLSLNEKAQVVTYAVVDGEQIPETFQYQNENGQKFLVYAFDSANLKEERYRCYCMQRQLYRSLRWLTGDSLPAQCVGHPDLYIFCSRNENGMAVGLWNFFADEIDQPVIELAESYKEAEFVNCQGTLEGNRVILSQLPAFGWAFVHLKHERQ